MRNGWTGPCAADRLVRVVWIRFFLLLAAAFSITAATAEARHTDGNTVRVFAVGNKQRVADGVSYKTYADGTGWHYDNREYLQSVASLVSKWSKLEAEQVTPPTGPALVVE